MREGSISSWSDGYSGYQFGLGQSYHTLAEVKNGSNRFAEVKRMADDMGHKVAGAWPD